MINQNRWQERYQNELNIKYCINSSRFKVSLIQVGILFPIISESIPLSLPTPIKRGNHFQNQRMSDYPFNLDKEKNIRNKRINLRHNLLVTCWNMDGRIRGLVNITSPSVLARGPNCTTSFQIAKTFRKINFIFTV